MVTPLDGSLVDPPPESPPDVGSGVPPPSDPPEGSPSGGVAVSSPSANAIGKEKNIIRIATTANSFFIQNTSLFMILSSIQVKVNL